MKQIVNKSDVEALKQLDDLFATIDNAYGPPPSWSRSPGFAMLAQIILEQNVSVASANAHFKKLSEYIGTFTPENILRLSEDEMRSCHISRQKSSYLKGLAAAVKNGSFDIDELPGLTQEEAWHRLTALKGIGDWTAGIYLMFCLQFRDIFPSGDVALMSAMKELCKVSGRKEADAVAERWSPYRSLAAYYLWHYYTCRKRK
jgi:DNA-3-methyladenine glycosylase II